MDGSAVKAGVDMNPEPQSMPAGLVEACPPIESISLPDPAHLTDRVSIDMRGMALAIVTTVVVVFALQWAEKFFIPLVLGIIIAYTLNPLVVWLERIKIPRVVGTSLVMLAVIGGSAFVTISLRGQIQTILDQLPVAAGKLSVALRSMREGQLNTMQNVQAAAREIDKATSQAADIHSTPKQPTTHIVIEQPTF
jgi:predicted PurR-regulated permease PerM